MGTVKGGPSGFTEAARSHISEDAMYTAVRVNGTSHENSAP